MKEERELLIKAESPSVSPANTLSSLHQHVAMSAPTTPPHNPSALPGDTLHINGNYGLGGDGLRPSSLLIGKRKSVQYASSLTPSPESSAPVSNVINNLGSHNHAAGAKSMPASRRASAGSKDGEEAVTLALRNMHDANGAQRDTSLQNRLNGESQYNHAFSAALLFDEDLDNEMQSKLSFCRKLFLALAHGVEPDSLRSLPTSSDDDKFLSKSNQYARRVNCIPALIPVPTKTSLDIDLALCLVCCFGPRATFSNASFPSFCWTWFRLYGTQVVRVAPILRAPSPIRLARVGATAPRDEPRHDWNDYTNRRRTNDQGTSTQSRGGASTFADGAHRPTQCAFHRLDALGPRDSVVGTSSRRQARPR